MGELLSEFWSGPREEDTDSVEDQNEAVSQSGGHTFLGPVLLHVHDLPGSTGPTSDTRANGVPGHHRAGEYLTKECSEGRVLSPALFPSIHTSRFGVIPKGPSRKWRLMVNMSSSEGLSINNGIDESPSTMSHVGVVDVIKGIVLYSKAARLTKVDVRRAYCNIPMHPNNTWLMGMQWEGSLYVDTPFGLRSAPKVFYGHGRCSRVGSQTGRNPL